MTQVLLSQQLILKRKVNNQVQNHVFTLPIKRQLLVFVVVQKVRFLVLIATSSGPS